MAMYDNTGMTPGKVVKLIVTLFALIFSMFAVGNLVEHLNATDMMVVQYPSGKLVWHTTPGWKAQWFGAITVYHKRSQLEFLSPPKDKKDAPDNSVKIRFNDGGHAQVSGSIAWEMPVDDVSLTALHTKYGSQHAVEHQLVRTIVEKSLYMTGPLMSSKESSAERRNDMLRYVEDQIHLGVYQTKTDAVKEADPMTGAMKTVNYVRLVEKDGVVQRQETSPLKDFGIKTFNLTLNSIDYDDQVEKQITAQQQATMLVQTAIAKAKEAEQQAITAAKNGEAEAATAKWKQEVIKAQQVTEAEQKLKVAELEAKAAEQYKRKQILEGEGEAERRKLVMAADNALTQRLEAYVKVNDRWAQALENIKQPIVPSVQFGGVSNGQTGAQQLIDLLLAKTAKDIGVDAAPGTPTKK